MKKSSRIIVGVDEAGRGPVLGPLVMAALAFKEEDIQKLEWLGVKDSKLLSSSAREELFEPIRELVHDFRIEVIEPDAIDLSLTESTSNLNWLEAETSARLVSELNPDKVIIDCPSPNIPAYKNYFSSKLSPGVLGHAEIVMEHKADLNHIVVAAASVIAKVIRDRQIDKLKSEINFDFGSGYMPDPKTQQFLNDYHDKFPHLFRKKWQSYVDAVN
ncbi:MAG TPA: ribonuclease HII, partial [Candidatus Nanoarchaeia archaeon]|nr:ribonuclease HII [Candidatus Nanoarchaeia archaeon]